MNLDSLQRELCSSLCAEVRVIERADGYYFLDTPFEFADGDHYSLFLKFLPTGGVRITDRGTTFMRLSYLNDLAKFKEGTRGRLLDEVVAGSGLSNDDGEFYVDVAGQQLGSALVRFGQAITRISDLSFLNRTRVASTFYEDLREEVERLVGPGIDVVENYMVPDVPNAEAYPVDLFVRGDHAPLYIFGVPDQGKARLATIILQYLRMKTAHQPMSERFNSLVVFQNQSIIPNKDVSRLINAATMSVDTLEAHDDMRYKIEHGMH